MTSLNSAALEVMSALSQYASITLVLRSDGDDVSGSHMLPLLVAVHPLLNYEPLEPS